MFAHLEIVDGQETLNVSPQNLDGLNLVLLAEQLGLQQFFSLVIAPNLGVQFP